MLEKTKFVKAFLIMSKQILITLDHFRIRKDDKFIYR